MKSTLKLRSIAFLCFTFISLGTMAGGGWTHAKGTGYFKLGQSILRSDKFYDANGDIVSIFTTSVYQTSLYGEYGFTDRLNGVLYTPFFSRVTLNRVEFASGRVQEGDEHNGIGDSRIGLQYGLISGKPFVMSVSAFLGLPLGTTNGGNTQALQTGDGEFNQLIKLDASYGFQKIPAFASASVGFNNRTKGFSEEYHIGAEVGYIWKKKLITIFKFATIQSFKNGDASGSANGIFSNDLEFVSFTPEIAYLITDQWGATANYGTAIAGERVLAAPAYSFGIFYNMR